MELEYDFFLYVIFIIFYIILFVFFFINKTESIIFIILFAFILLSGFKVLLELKNNTETFNININNINEFTKNIPLISLVANILFSGFGTLILLFLMVLGTILYTFKRDDGRLIIASGVVLFVTFIITSFKKDEKIPYYVLYAIPNIGVLLSLLLLLIKRSEFKKDSIFEAIKFSKSTKRRINNIKGLIVSIIVLFILGLLGALNFLSENSSMEVKKNVTIYTIFIIILLYTLTGRLLYETVELMDIKNNK